MENKQLTIQSVLRSEWTWLATVVVATIGFFNMVVLPLNKVQLQLAQIQSDLSVQSQKYQALEVAVNALNTAVGVLKSRLDTLTKN